MEHLNRNYVWTPKKSKLSSGPSSRDDFSSTISLTGHTGYNVKSDAIGTLNTECSVCTSTSPTSTFPVLKSCTHDADVCETCFLQWLTSQMSSVESITCPSSNCATALTHQDVREHAPPNIFTRFDELSVRSLLSADEKFLYCLAEGCPSGQVHDTGIEGPIFRCAGCGFRMCTAHIPIIPFHENETCNTYTERMERERQEREARQEEDTRRKREDEEASAAEVKKNAVECPGCGVQIHKMAGCDHMTCKLLVFVGLGRQGIFANTRKVAGKNVSLSFVTSVVRHIRRTKVYGRLGIRRMMRAVCITHPGCRAIMITCPHAEGMGEGE